MNEKLRYWLFHLALLEVEVLVWGSLVLFPFVRHFRPEGITSTGRGDLLRFRIAEGQDEMMERCDYVQIDFGTKYEKRPPATFYDRELVKYEKLNKSNRYVWHEIPAPRGTTVFRIAYHWKKECKPSTQGPNLKDISLGNCSIQWSDMRDEYELYAPETCPCYWFRPEWFWNVSALGMLTYVGGYFLVVNVLVLLIVLIIKHRSKPSSGGNCLSVD